VGGGGTDMCRILFLEDNPVDVTLLADELAQGGLVFTWERVATRAAFFERLAAEPAPDLVLADYTLAGFDAPAVLREMRDRGVCTPLIVVTGTVGEDRAVACMREGAADYLLKDRLARLGTAVRRVLDEARARRARSEVEQALEQQMRFEAMLAGISTQLIHADAADIDAAIMAALRTVGESQGFARVFVQLLDPTREYFQMTHEWCAPGVGSFQRSMTGLPVSKFGWPLDRIRDGHAVVLVRDELPPEAETPRRVMERDGLASLAALPLRAEGQVLGMVGFHRQDARRQTDETLMRLNLLGEVVSNAIARQRHDAQRRAAFEELERLRRAAERERDYLREEIEQSARFREIIGSSPALTQVLELIAAVAATRASVLVEGESGTGKELVARAIHAASDRADHPLVKVNCASIPKDLFESEFFGHVKGAFTGAYRDRVGRFELADGGTIFLDEVGELPLAMQSKLLRVLQEGELERVGDDRTRSVDVRVIAATNRDLEAEVREGGFRADLFYRLRVFPIVIPPLRARREDIVLLAEHFLARSCHNLGIATPPLDDGHRALLVGYDWPGNIRELSHVMERAAILCRVSGTLRLDVAPVPERRAPASAILTADELRKLERDNIVQALERVDWQVGGTGGAAALLGLSASTLRDRMKALGIQRPS
jgi:formate hydrogenlyase transcriptional activator